MDTPEPDVTYGAGGHPIGGYGRCTTKDKNSGCDCGTKPCGFYVYNHSSTAVINGQTFQVRIGKHRFRAPFSREARSLAMKTHPELVLSQEWWLNDYIFNEVGSSKLVHGFYW
jgi:hypothetical protein